ncbi:MAG TPA: hypothetical protein VK781_10205 [Solirubrobacteraceae bacterium]|nr:hypothetical protein [Solirubrobacteraceae bacterium]
MGPSSASPNVSNAAPQTSGTLATPVLNLSTGELDPILSSVPISDLGLSEAGLGELLSELSPGLGSSAGGLTGLVSNLLASDSGATLGELVSSLSSQGGVLGTLLKTLLPGLEPNQIVEALSPTQLNGLLDNLTGGGPSGALTSEQLSQLLDGLTGKLSGQQLESLEQILDGLLGGASLSPTTVGALAEQVGMTPEALAEEVGADSESLPAAAPALQAALGSEGPVLGVVKGVSGLAVTLLPKALKGGETGENGGNGESGGNGQNGGNGENGLGGAGGGGGANGAPGNGAPGTNGLPGANGGPGGSGAGTTTIVAVPPAGAPTGSVAPGKLAKVKILSHRVKGGVATIVVQVPAAGQLVLSGKGVRSSLRKVGGAKRITLKVTLTRAGAASLRKRHNRLRVRLAVAYRSTGGQRSSAMVTVGFK